MHIKTTEPSKQEPAKPEYAGLPKRDKTSGTKAFDFLNYFGLGFAVNSALSLFITYNVMPTKGAQNFVGGLTKGLTPIAHGWHGVKKMVGLGKAIAEEERKLHIHESARSAAEIMCMCIAGFVVLVPMGLMEMKKKWFVHKVDEFQNKDYHKAIKEKGLEAEPLPVDHEPKQSWGRLLSARMGGVATVIGIDAGLQMFNNKRHSQGKWNLDTAEWKLGSGLYDLLPKGVTERFVRFFSARKTADLSGIQKPILERLEQTVGHDPKRMMFAEQSRLFSKELSLTLVMAGVVYSLAKTGVMSKILSKFGLKKESEQKEAIDNMMREVPLVPVTEGKIDIPDKYVEPESQPQAQADPSKFTEKYARLREIHAPKPQESFAKKVAAASEQNAGTLIGA